MATQIRKLAFENLLPHASMSKDSDLDGVADGFRKATDATAITEWFFDDAEKAQVINALSSTAPAGSFSNPGVENEEFIPVTPNQIYTASCEVRGEGYLGNGNGPRIIIRWYDQNKQYISGAGSSPYVGQEWQRISTTQTAPSNARYARIKPDFRITPDSTGGTGWYRKAQFQEGDTATDYEETDFFTIVNVAITYASGWSAVNVGGNRVWQSEQLPAGSTTWTGGKIQFLTPKETDTAEMSLYVDTSQISPTEKFQLFINGVLRLEVPGGSAPETRTVTDLPRGNTICILRHHRPNDGTSNGQTIRVDDITITWTENTAVPGIELPTKKVVKYIDFESDSYDHFFRVIDTAPGYTYGFERSFRQRSSGYWSYTVKDTADSGGTDEVGRPPTIPNNEKAGAIIRFRIPSAAIDPYLKLKAMYNAEAGFDIGRIYLNGQLLWQGERNNLIWEDISSPLVAGNTYEILLEYEKDESNYSGDDAIFIDDIIVAYDVPAKPYLFIGTGQETKIRTGAAASFTAELDFESPLSSNGFFTITNPSRQKSGGGPSEYPEAGWVRTSAISFSGSYCIRAQRERTKNNEDAAIDITFQVPHGVKNAVARWWNFVELERSVSVPSGAQYHRLFEEYRIWVNGSIWKEFHYCSPNLTESVHYIGPSGPIGSPANDYACPWGRWWEEELPLTPGQSYTITFEMQRDAGDSSPIHGRDLCCIDDFSVSWEESPGNVVTIPPEPLVYLDGRDGYAYVDERSGAEMAPLSFAEYQVFGVPGSVHQHTIIEPRPLDLTILIEAENRQEVRQKIRELTKRIANRQLSIVAVHPEEIRMIQCHFENWESSDDERSSYWRKAVLSFRCFDPFWYGEWLTYDGDDPSIQGAPGKKDWIRVENPGDQEAWPIIKIYGPITDPLVELAEVGGETIGIFQLGISVPSSRHIIIDTRPGQKTIILDDGTNLYRFLSPSLNNLFSIPPGQYEVFLFGTNKDGTTKIAVELQPPYWGI